MEHWLTIANESGRSVTLGHQDSLVLDGITLGVNESAQAWWVKRGGGNASQEGTFTVDTDVSCSGSGDQSWRMVRALSPWLAIQVGQTYGLYVGWEFSGVGRIHAQTISTRPTKLNLRVGNLPEFKTELRAEETLLIPSCFRRLLSGGHR
ncbi:MAG: hypothetical protein U0V70_19265 [Terriglobia bacterium]